MLERAEADALEREAQPVDAERARLEDLGDGALAERPLLRVEQVPRGEDAGDELLVREAAVKGVARLAEEVVEHLREAGEEEAEDGKAGVGRAGVECFFVHVVEVKADLGASVLEQGGELGLVDGGLRDLAS